MSAVAVAFRVPIRHIDTQGKPGIKPSYMQSDCINIFKIESQKSIVTELTEVDKVSLAETDVPPSWKKHCVRHKLVSRWPSMLVRTTEKALDVLTSTEFNMSQQWNRAACRSSWATLK